MEEPSLLMAVWPWIGLGAAIVIVILLFATDWLRSTTTGPRWKDPTWFAWVAAAAYMLHNIEEYGIDVTGTTEAFPDMMINGIGVEPAESFFLVVNIGLVWIAGPLAAHLSRRMPVLVLAMPGVELINSLLHLPGAIALGSIGAGFATALVLFVPIVAWALVGFCGRSGYTTSTFVVFVGIGGVYHLGFVVTIIPLAQGIGPDWLPALTMAIFTAILLGLWRLAAGRVARSTPARAAAEA